MSFHQLRSIINFYTYSAPHECRIFDENILEESVSELNGIASVGVITSSLWLRFFRQLTGVLESLIFIERYDDAIS